MKEQENAGFPLSAQQKHLWLLQQSWNGSPLRAQCAIAIEGNLDVDVLENSLRSIVERHEILRTSFHRQPGVKIPFQVIDDVGPRWEHVDLSGYESHHREIRIEELLRAEGDHSLDFENGSPLRLLLVTKSSTNHLLIVTLPAICADSRTLKNLVHELVQLYGQDSRDEALLQEPMQYADFSQWQNELLAGEDEEAKLGKAFWEEQQLSSPPGLLPFEGEHDEQNEPDVAAATPIHDIAEFDGVADKQSFLFACWQTLLWRLTGQSDFVVEAISDGRDYEELQGALGPYAKSLPLNCSFANNPPFSEVVEQIQESLDSAREWQAYLNPEEGTASRGNTSAIAFEFNEIEPKQQARGVTFSVFFQDTCIDRFRLKLCCVVSEKSLTTEFHHDSALFPPKTMERIVGHFATVMESALRNPEARVSELAVLSEAERRQLLIGFNKTKSNYRADRCIHELFEEQVEKTPAATAVVFEDERLSYEELNARANQLAHFLLQRGVGPEVKVGLCVERSLEMIVGLLGILKSGAAYVPLSPEHPKARLLAQLTDIQAPVVLTQEKLVSQLPDFDGEVVCLDRDRAQFESQQTTNPRANVTPQQLIYVIYTSGSTGVPKGVAVTHQNLVNYTDFICKKLNLDPKNALVFASVSTITADLGNTCIFPSLVSGGCLHILNYEAATDAAQFADYVSRNPIDVLKIVPSHLSSLLDSNPKSNLLPRRYLILGGEALSWELVERIRAINPECQVINHYGPTETTVGSLTFALGRNGALAKSTSTVPIGRPIANTEVFILDQSLNPVPLGVSGQLYIGGAGVSQNYLNQPEQTADRFIANPFSNGAATRLYKTGDRARYLADGNVEFLGRGDDQVKIRGYRVELGEVEATLRGHDGVRKAVVLAREVDEGNKQLVAYVVAAIDKAPTVSELRAYLKEIVPEYMVPSAFVFLKDIPLTRNGKVDRASLPIPDPSRPELEKTFVAPGTPTEELVAGIWAELLKLKQVGIHDNFFELGGHSLLATQVISRLRETFQVELPLSSLFETPTVAGVAQRIEAARFASQELIATPILPAPRGKPLPLSFAQQRLWLLDQLEPGNSAYNVSRAVRVRGPFNYAALRKTLDTLTVRHESLRTTFIAVDGMPYQVIAENVSLPMCLIDLAELPAVERRQEAEKLVVSEARQPYDLARGPLTRVTVIRLETDHHILLLNNHHIISDGWSAGILFDELAILYRAYSLDQSPQLPPLPVQYSDYAVWQREWLEDGGVLQQEIDYWKQQLDGAPALLELPTDRPRPAVQTHRGARERIKLPAELTQAIKTLSQRESVTLFMFFLATFQLLLSRHSGQDDIVVGSPIAGRTRAEIERLIGFFLNTLVLRTQLTGDPTFRDLLMHVRDVALEAYAHQHIPFEKLIEELQPARDLSHTPLFQVFLNVLNFSPIRIDLPGLTIEDLPTPDVGSKFDMTLYAVEQKDGMTLELLYNTDLFEADRVAAMLRQFQFLLEQIVERPDEKISSYSLVTPSHKQLLPDPTQALVGTSRPAIHTLFSDQARRNPNQLAVLDQTESWTYSELDYRSNQLANYLLTSGIKTGDRVAIYAHRSVPLVWAVMGVLKAGAAFVILDPAYPVSRLISCLEVAQPRAWLQITAAGAVPDRLDEFVDTLSCCCRVELPADENLLSGTPGDDPQVKVDADDLAYVAFTSGSTGIPKGILGRHGPLTLFTTWAKDLFDLDETDRFSMLSGLAHDPLHRDIFTPLQLGATLCIPDPEDLAVPPQLVNWFNERKITIANLTPAMAQLLCETTWTTSPMRIDSLRYSFLVGDVLTKRDAARLKVLAPSITCVNLYGSTETQRAVGHFIVPPVPAHLSAGAGQRPIEKEILPLGRGIQGVQLLLLNSAQQLSGVGEVGEIYFRSPHLAKGYLGDPVLTKERFLLNPFTKAPGDRLYRTGDLGRYLPDGNVEFLRRADRQVKVRGFRIELGEVEAVLAAHPDVRQSIVILRDKDSTEKYLTAYLVTVQGSKLTISDLRRDLKEKLPDYMIPAAFVVLEALPLTPNGKVDLKALPAPDQSRSSLEEDFMAPRTVTEEKLASIWAAVLKVERVGINDNFFELGGHSLLATQVVGRIRNSLQIDLPLRALFEAPTIKGLGEKLRALTAANGNRLLSAITPVSRNGAMPLSFAQQRLWFLNELEGESAFYNITWAVRLRGELDVHALREAIRTIINRHETLRTSFTVVEEQPFQVISDRSNLAFRVTDLSELPEGVREDEAKSWGSSEGRQPFDLQTGPLIRARLLRLSTDEYVLCVNAHHIVSDGWSIGIFVRELTELYESYLTGRPHRLPELPIQYADYAVWQREWLQGEVLEQQLTYWKEQLRDAPAVLELPKDRPRPAVQTFRGATRTTELTAELTRALNEFSQQEGVTLFMTLLAAFQVLLSRYSGQQDIVVGSPIAGRNQEETEQLIGIFVNTLMLRTDVSGNPSFRELLNRVREVALGAYANQEMPFEKLVDELQPERSLSYAPLFQVMFVLQNAPRSEFKLRGLTLTRMRVGTETSKFDLTLFATESAGNLRLAFEYNTDLFDAVRIDRMLEHMRILLESVVRTPETRIAELEILTQPERKQLLLDWNETAAEFDAKRIHELFEEQVERTPDATAVVFETEQVTYRELNRRANQLAHYLQRRDVGPDVLVGVCVERSLEMVVALYGILKTGGAYVPLDPAYPAERLRFMLNDANVRLLLTQQSLLQLIPETPAEVVCLDRDWAEISNESAENPATRPAAENLAYVIYTSGSTGKPKGVAIEHRSTAALLAWAKEVFSPEELDGVLASTSICFDLSVFELFVPLSFGGKVLLVRDVLELLSFASAKDVKLINTVPSAMTELLRLGGLPENVETVNLAGEPLQTSLVEKIYQQPQIRRVFDLYGPSEDTTYSTFALRLPDGPTTIGRPISNTRVYLLDSSLQPVPVGVPGELYLGGAGLSRGYLKRPELTANVFVPDPFSAESGARLYKTGDLARYLEDGNVEYLGRIDNQVKLRGFRIELGEIEAVIKKHPQVSEALVMVREDEPGDRRLVAYVVPDRDEEVSKDRLQQGLKGVLIQELPEYMRPSAFVFLHAFPLTPNGKINRSALPAPEHTRSEERYVAPRNATEEKLASIWAAVLKVERVGINDNFFELGGHSLLATQVVGRIRNSLQIDLPLRALFEAPTIKGLGEKLRVLTTANGNGLLSAITPVSRNGEMPLSFAQQRLWFLNELDGESAFYNITWAVRLRGELDVHALREAIRTIINRHETLRTSFTVVEEQPFQVISDRSNLAFRVTDLSELPEGVREDEAKRWRNTEARQRFDLQTGPLIRARLLRLRTDDYVLSINFHHIVSDGWSVGVFVRELTELYESFVTGRPHRLPELPIQYADYAIWQREWLQGEVLEKQLTYWKEQLRGVPGVLDLPKDRSRPAVQTFRGGNRSIWLNEELTQTLSEVSRQEGVTLFMTLLAAFKVLLWRYSSQEDIVVGSPIAGRNQEEIEQLIGFFVNTLMLRTDVSGNPTFRELLDRVKKVALEAYANQELPFEKLVDELQPERSLSHAPLFQVMFVLQNAPRGELKFKDLTLIPMKIETNASKFDLTLFATDHGGTLRLAFEYSTDLFDEARIDRMLEHLRILLEGVVRTPETRIAEFEILTTPERKQLLLDWNETAAEFDAKRIHELFEEQVERTPDAPAVIFEKEQLTYRELNQRANQLAQYLKKRGVGPDVLVGVCVERSLEMVVALYGILKAGGAYVPLDPAYPAERLQFMLEDANARLLLTQQSLLRLIPESATEVVCLDRDWSEINEESPVNPATKPAPENLAYVLFTSGSTGRPKGVMIPHGAISNHMLWMQTDFPLTAADRVLQKTPFSFDASVWEFYAPLLAGAQLVMAQPGGHQDSAYLVKTIAEKKITILQLVPTMLQLMLEEPELETCDSLRHVFVGGEALTFELQEQFFRRLSKAQLINLYGPTEATIDATYHSCEPGNTVVPIGRPVSNTVTYVLDRHLNPLPVGIAGELYIGGADLARGYLNRPELTANAFVPDPFSAEGGARLYKTGDLAQYLEDGNIQYLGRIDNQLKLRGFRIELGEIEAVIKKHAQVSESIVLVREDEPGDRRLVAYVVSTHVVPNRDAVKSGTRAVQSVEADLKTLLIKQLPEYMRPSEFIFLDVFPLTPNGKIDRSALPRPGPSRPDLKGAYVAPRTEIEKELATIWADVLRRELVGVNDNFFELGGHSLLATQVVSRIRKHLKLELPLRTMFESPTVAGLATAVELQQKTKPAPLPAIKRRRRGTAKVEQLSPDEVDSLLSEVLSKADPQQ